MTDEEAYGQYLYDQAQGEADAAKHYASEAAAAEAQAQAEADDELYQAAYLEGRRYQHQQDVEWLEKYLLAYMEVPGPLGATAWPTLGEIAQQRPAVKLAYALVEAFKNMKIK